MAGTPKKHHSRDLVSAVLFLKLSATEKLVLMALCWHYPNPYPSVARIAALASRSKRCVRNCLRSLQEKGLIEVHYRRDGQAQDTSFYTINPDRILMQAGRRAKTTMKGGGTGCRGVGQSLPGEGEEATSAKQRALDKEQKQDNKQQNITAKEPSKPTCQDESSQKQVGGILSDPPPQQMRGSDKDVDEQLRPEKLGEPHPCVETSQSANLHPDEHPTHPHPPLSAAPPSPSLPSAGNKNVATEALTPEQAFDKAIKMSQYLRKPQHQNWEQGQGVLKLWLAHCQKHGAHIVLEAFEYFLKNRADIPTGDGTPMVDFCAMGVVIIRDMLKCKANSTKAA